MQHCFNKEFPFDDLKMGLKRDFCLSVYRSKEVWVDQPLLRKTEAPTCFHLQEYDLLPKREGLTRLIITGPVGSKWIGALPRESINEQ